MVIPKKHLIAQYFDVESEDITFHQYRENVKKELRRLFYETAGFYPQYITQSDEHINWRYPLMLGYHIRDIIKGKTLVDIGSRYGEHDYMFSLFCKKIYSYEIESKIHRDSLNRDYKCERVAKHMNIYDEKDLPNADIYFTWISYTMDLDTLDFVVNTHRKNGCFLLGIPQANDEGQMDKFFGKIRTWLENNPFVKMSYISLPFDESMNYQDKYCKRIFKFEDNIVIVSDQDEVLVYNQSTKGLGKAQEKKSLEEYVKGLKSFKCQQFPIKTPTHFTNQTTDAWNEWRTYENQWGTMFLFKFVINRD